MVVEFYRKFKVDEARKISPSYDSLYLQRVSTLAKLHLNEELCQNVPSSVFIIRPDAVRSFRNIGLNCLKILKSVEYFRKDQ